MTVVFCVVGVIIFAILLGTALMKAGEADYKNSCEALERLGFNIQDVELYCKFNRSDLSWLMDSESERQDCKNWIKQYKVKNGKIK